MKTFKLIQLDVFKSEVQIKESLDLIKWFKSSPDDIKHKLSVSTFYPTNYSNQLDSYICEYFVCLHTFNSSVLSTIYLSKVIWTIKFHEFIENSLSSKHTIQDFRNELHDFCTMIKYNSHDTKKKT